MDLNIIITTNGPGEIAAWVQPVVEKLRNLVPHARIIIALVPCPHSSGYEAQVSSRFLGASVLLPSETTHFLLTGKLPPHVVLAREGVILHLGGDQLFSVSLGWRTRFPVVVYTEKLAQWPSQVQRFLLRDEGLYTQHRKHKIPAHKLVTVGDLMVDSVHPTLSSTDARNKLNLSQSMPVVSLLPGSKPLKVLYSTSYMLKIADELSYLLPETQFILPQSPFTPLAQLREAVQDPRYISVLGGVPGKIVHDRNSTFIVTPQGNKIQVVPPTWNHNALQVSDLSITLPGTNTAELAILGIPMVVILPLNKPEVLPVEGLGGQLCRLPLLGPALKRLLIHQILKKLRFVSIPNQKAERLLVPEIVGNTDPLEIAQKAFQLLMDPLHRRETSLTLRSLMPAQNTAETLVQNLLEIFELHYACHPHPIPYRHLDSSHPPQPTDSDSTSGTKRSG
ncbi:hypothetical protein COW36_02070 [bacterium (Candidatus Blackallbacteria) CG17_big_fil_post_rev_8_21_14_2_50_48_46]|uniref:Uncharacterized protein n=1 Tax=bacterium (Candidatus Blackallbacteria) CG17_big_fil_post_rev_8_21_14_2_50_48_46 TaxID=2014261 RepID=A0A2M7GAP4_9BACT|nr:MAG: hypothetical protein COW64_26460 [bacterium (Candidatus Blackallbacteria) CG18_big_fil_WC_8_21_14_2_50_49_26]PIW19221.1 MAG: hypothetical protein COW36_02070 [bacterium (Candidatus Blackallbacteria) CG17_big_fil_post_rev_8_21_14_2_50_48_46]PIW45429.1 MAG: hypothetical protein COW20_20070 [bacterium (Candidatus Blackallbacteria) CG13_big_fil_rev_8_21_14_2_50_49_14]